MNIVSLSLTSVRELNEQLRGAPEAGSAPAWRVTDPKGAHAVAAGLTGHVQVQIDGHVGYYCAGMNQHAAITVDGHCGTGVAENMMSGIVRIRGNASQSAGASGHGGMLVIEGDAGPRCGISMKGIDIVVGGKTGHMSGFMAQSGNLVICGDAGDDLGDSIYEAVIYVGGSAASLGADCVEKEMTPKHRSRLQDLLSRAGMERNLDRFRRFGSARKLYHFHVDHADSY